MTTFELGINTCFAVKRWPRPTEWARIVRDDLGLALVQHSLDLVDLSASGIVCDTQANEARRACDQFGLHLESTFTGLAAYSSNLLLHPEPYMRHGAEEWYQRAIDFTAAVDATATGGHIGAYSVADWADERRRRSLAHALNEALTRLSAYARSVGVMTIYVENLAAAREPSTIEGINRLVRAGDDAHASIALCLDVGHQCVQGTEGDERDPYAWLRHFADTCSMVQLQQSDDKADHHWPFTEATNAAGRIDAERVLDSLERSSLDRIDLVLEVIPAFEAPDADVIHDLVASVEYWRKAIG